MSTEIEPTLEPAAPTPRRRRDPFRHGWRYVKIRRNDGKLVWRKKGLTLRDILFPQEDDYHVTTAFHHLVLYYLEFVLSVRLRDLPGGFGLLVDHRMSWNYPIPGPAIEPMGPDLAAIPRFPADWNNSIGTFPVGPDNVPWLLIEVVSPGRRRVDYDWKPPLYARAGARRLVIIDQRITKTNPRVIIENHFLQNGAYILQPPDAAGLHRMPEFGIGIYAPTPYRIAAIDLQTGEEIATSVEEVDARRAAEAQARRDAQARIDAETQARRQLQARAQAEGRSLLARRRARKQAEVIAELQRELDRLRSATNEPPEASPTES